MKADFDMAARKRPVNLTLNEDLVSQAKSMTDNLSAVVESLLAQFVSRERRERLQRSQAVEATVAAWNEFNSKSGSIADEYSSL
ncbi:MAG TPA: type II toxin-antitoxin system CcdA family antitoxin [Steroidobacteraceae bacterium]|jgi:antitoxin CcdA|nr:type II toxin-antitoxin system CcdA family antitoxin [Steroidobacteraceae bacterium]